MTIVAGLAVAAAGYPGYLGVAAWRRRRDRALATNAWIVLLEAGVVPRSLVVHARAGCIILEGEVEELPQALAARELIAAVAGVRQVRSRIRVREAPTSGTS